MHDYRRMNVGDRVCIPQSRTEEISSSKQQVDGEKNKKKRKKNEEEEERDKVIDLEIAMVHLVEHRSEIDRVGRRSETECAECVGIVTFVMRLLRPGDGLVFLPPLALSDDPPRCHRRRRARSRGHRACGRRGHVSRNYELDLRLHPRLADDLGNDVEALALEGPAVPLDHLVT